MLVAALAGLLLLLSGILAGVLASVDFAVVPMLRVLPGDRLVEVHRLLDPGFDPLMPRISKVALMLAIGLVFLADGVAPRAWFALNALCTIGVAVISETRNVRMNRRIESWDVEHLPADWEAVRTGWARAHRARTAVALVGFIGAINAGVVFGP